MIFPDHLQICTLHTNIHDFLRLFSIVHYFLSDLLTNECKYHIHSAGIAHYTVSIRFFIKTLSDKGTLS